jgi:hypothetical protein
MGVCNALLAFLVLVGSLVSSKCLPPYLLLLLASSIVTERDKLPNHSDLG